MAIDRLVAASSQVRVGGAAVLRVALTVLLSTLALTGVALGAAAALAPSASLAVRRLAVSLACAASALAIRRRAEGVAPEDASAVYALYMELWKYFYGAYLCLPLAR